jgi:hypothetical protein
MEEQIVGKRIRRRYVREKATPMMGCKERYFAPLIHASLEDLVPADHFYRHLDQSLDLSFVREFVQKTYAGGGRPSIDPIVFFKLHLVLFFEAFRSERLLMRHAADRLSVRWYLGVRRFGACEIAPQEQEVESKEPSRATDRPDAERQRGK